MSCGEVEDVTAEERENAGQRCLRLTGVIGNLVGDWLSVNRSRRVPAGMLPARHARVRNSLGRLRRERAHMLACVHVIADRGKPLQDALPLRPIKLAQEGPKSLNERILEHRLTVALRHEETVQTNSERFGDLLERAEAGGHLTALNAGKI